MSDLKLPPAILNRILVVDDEALIARMVAYIIQEAELGLPVQCADSREVMKILAGEAFDLVLLDLNMPWIGGQELLAEISRDYPDIPVLILTNEDRIEVAVECMRKGAFDFMTKPLERNRLISAIRHALTIRELKREVNILSTRRDERPLENPEAFAGIITCSKAMRSLFAYIEAVAKSPKAILVTGESGTGKELIANVIHTLSGRSGRFVPINVSGLEDTVFSDSLFGHLKGSYTGADGARKGLVEQARDGTLFLDEIGDLESGPQIKLLRLLQEGEYYPLGSDTPMKSRARIVAATNASLKDKQNDGGFRRDLYFRLVSHHIELPPLRDRREDIQVLLEHFVQDAARIMERDAPRIPDLACRMLSSYDFPGNIRELQGIAFDAVSRTRGPILETASIRAYLLEHQPGLNLAAFEMSENRLGSLAEVVLPEAVMTHANESVDVRSSQVTSVLPIDPVTEPVGAIRGPADLWVGEQLPAMQDVENFLYGMALKRTGGNQSAAAVLLGVSQSTLSRWFKLNRAGKVVPE
jgi:DNA-binding NtrC family response regulator